jgi:hypothetical protein
MRSGIFFVGLFILIAGAVGLLYYYPTFEQLSSNYSQIGMLAYPQIMSYYNTIQQYMIASIIGVISGIAIIAMGVNQTQETDEYLFQTILTPEESQSKILTPEKPGTRTESIQNGAAFMVVGGLLITSGIFLMYVRVTNVGILFSSIGLFLELITIYISASR